MILGLPGPLETSTTLVDFPLRRLRTRGKKSISEQANVNKSC